MIQTATGLHWLGSDGAIKTCFQVLDPGPGEAEFSGDVPPPGTSFLSPEDLVEVFRVQLLVDRRLHELRQERAEQLHESSMQRHEEKLAVLTASGLSPDAVKVLSPPPPPPLRRSEYQPPLSISSVLVKYGLSPEQVERVLAPAES